MLYINIHDFLLLLLLNLAILISDLLLDVSSATFLGSGSIKDSGKSPTWNVVCIWSQRCPCVIPKEPGTSVPGRKLTGCRRIRGH